MLAVSKVGLKELAVENEKNKEVQLDAVKTVFAVGGEKSL